LRALALAVALVAALLGCGGHGTYPVHGKIVYEDDGSPVRDLEGQTISFESTELGKAARGTLTAEGTFTLTTAGVGDGAFPATYKVSLTQPYPAAGRPRPQGKVVVDKIYEDPEKTPLTAQVGEKDNEFTFKLKRKPR
jgi:hypothetical protein